MATATPAVNPAAPALLTIEEYLQTAYHPDCEFIDGHLEERTMGTTRHGYLQAILSSWFHTRRKQWGTRVMSDVRTRVASDRMRLPDIAVVRSGPSADYPAQSVPPLIVIELLSPEDRINRVLIRLEDFHRMGVENIWLIDPEERIACTYTANGLRLHSEPRLTVSGSPIYLDLPEIFAELDETLD